MRILIILMFFSFLFVSCKNRKEPLMQEVNLIADENYLPSELGSLISGTWQEQESGDTIVLIGGFIGIDTIHPRYDLQYYIVLSDKSDDMFLKIDRYFPDTVFSNGNHWDTIKYQRKISETVYRIQDFSDSIILIDEFFNYGRNVKLRKVKNYP